MPAIKNYYEILEVEPSATLQEIKKAYRKLALQLHPDKTNNDPLAAARFADIKEAYEVLTDPAKKDYYLQQRWYNQSTGRYKTQSTVTPYTILQQSLELERHVAGLDIFRMDKPGLQAYILDLLSDSTIEKLQAFNEPDICREIISTILRSMHPLPKQYNGPLAEKLARLAGSDQPSRQLLNDFITRTNQKYNRQRYSLLTIIIITAVLCLLIYLAGR